MIDLLKSQGHLSYTSASSFPWKVIQQAAAALNNGSIRPIHAQFIPTNRCNRACPMCSCAKRDKTLEMSLDNARSVIAQLAHLGCKAATITGGGEPLLHPAFSSIVASFRSYGIKLGMATNGLLLHTTPVFTLAQFTWIRISNDDSRDLSGEYADHLATAIQSAPGVDWAFSHVVGSKPNFGEIRRVVRFANEHDFTHVRLVPDLFDVENVDLRLVKQHLRDHSIPDGTVIYQGRSESTPGGECRVGYLKPLIGPDCKVYACCGVQYALDPPTFDLPPELCIGDALKLDELYTGKQSPLDGSVCNTCYYQDYNQALRNLVTPLQHGEFV